MRYYSAMDCLRVTATDLATAAAVLAGTGAVACETRRVMLRCGMYEESTSWSATVGLPAKSGVSGVVWAIIPGVGGVCVQQPRIDRHGNGVEAMAVLKAAATIAAEQIATSLRL